jgi:hypothetical protein
MALRADREVQLVALRDLEELRNRRGIEIEVGVDERDPLAVRGERADLDGVALSEIAVVVDDTGPLLARREQPLGRVVERAVRDDDQLEVRGGEACHHKPPDLLDVADDLVAPVVDGDDDRQQRPRLHPGDPRRGVRRLR